MGSEVVLPSTGELVDLSEMATDEIAGQVDYYGQISQTIGRFRRAATDELATRLDYETKQTFDAGDWKISINAPTEKRWDVDRLADTLDKFVETGVISQAAASRCLRVKTEVAAREVEKLIKNPRTAPEISLCYEVVPATRKLTVSRV